MVTITVPALIIRVRLWYAMDMPPMANNCLAVEHADGKAARTRLPRLSRSSPLGDPACLPRTQQFAWPHAHLWRLAYDRLKLDQKKARMASLS